MLFENRKRRGNIMKIKYSDVKHSTWYGKNISYIHKHNPEKEEQEQILVQECDYCYGFGNVVTKETELKSDLEWEYIDCPKCDGEIYIEKK